MAKTDEVNEINQKLSRIRERRDESVLDKKVSLSVKTMASVLLIAVFIAGSFLAGRYVFPSGSSVIDSASAAATVDSGVSDDLETELLLEADGEETSTESSTETAADESSNETEETEESIEETFKETTEDAVETFTNSGYENVELAFSKTPTFNWKGTWGKVSTIYYTITNNEVGTIKPSKFRVIVEGYDSNDFIKTYDVPSIDKTIKSGEEAKHGFDVRLQYSESVTDPTNVQLTLQLLDIDGELMDAINEEFDLKE